MKVLLTLLIATLILVVSGYLYTTKVLLPGVAEATVTILDNHTDSLSFQNKILDKYYSNKKSIILEDSIKLIFYNDTLIKSKSLDMANFLILNKNNSNEYSKIEYTIYRDTLTINTGNLIRIDNSWQYSH